MRIERGLQVMTTTDDLPTWEPPPDEERDHEKYYVDFDPRCRYVARIETYRGRVVDFSLNLQHRPGIGQAWRDDYRVDCAHGTVHSHEYDEQGEEVQRTVLREISCQADVEAGWEDATDAVQRRGEAQAEGWASGQ